MIGKTNALEKGGKPEQTKTVEFNLGNNNSMIITPDEGYVLSRAEVSKPSTMLSENIKSGINIGGVVGTYEGSGGGSDGEVRSLKALLDLTKSCYYLFQRYTGNTIPEGIIEYNDTSNITNMGNMFYYANNLTTIPQLNTSNVIDMNGMFQGCNNLTTIPQIETSNVIYMSNMFQACSSLTTVPQLDTSKATGMANMFERCYKLTTIPQIETSNVIYMNNMFYECSSLTTIPKLNTSNVTYISGMFYRCSSLTTIPQLDIIKVKNTADMFNGCTNLTNLTLLNIQTNLQIGNGTSWGHLLTLDSLINTCKECIKQSSSKTLTVGSANLEKLASVYVKFTDPSQTEIAVGEKGDIVVCESTDEGAMLISDYMTLKSWTLA